MVLKMTQQTLEQLKAENAALSATTESLPPEVEEIELEAAAEETEEVTDQAGELETDETEDENAEAWMQTEAKDSDDKQPKKASFRGLKQKYKAKIGERDDEIERLRLENEQLKNGGVQTATQPQLPPKPKREDFNYDDDSFDAAVDAWNDAKLDLRLSQREQQSQQKNSVNTHRQSIEKAVDQHYEEVDQLVSSGKITEDQWLNSDRAVRTAIEAVRPGQGDLITDFLVSRLKGSGDGSSKVMYHVGVNAHVRDNLISKLTSDPDGITAAIYLGEIRAKVLSSTGNKLSQAPQPGSKLKGDAAPNTVGDKLKKQYDKLGAGTSASFNLKRQAKAAGADVSRW